MALRLENAYVGALQVSGGSNGVHVTRFAWTKSPRARRFPRGSAHGSVDRTRRYDGRLYELAGVIHGLTETQTHARLSDLERELALDDGADVLLKWKLLGVPEAEQAGVKIDGSLDYAFDVAAPNVLKWAATLFAGDPRRYSQTESIGSYDPTDANSDTGVEFPLVFPLEFAGDATTHLAAHNAGNFPTSPVLTITGPVVNPIIDNDTTGESWATTGLQLLAGDVAVVDMQARTFKVNGTSRLQYIDVPNTTWWELAPGTNSLRLRGSGMVALQTELAFSFRSARI